MISWTENILAEIEFHAATRKSVAAVYAAGIRYDESGVDWPRINRAILERWSKSALLYVKRQAWQINARLSEKAET